MPQRTADQKRRIREGTRKAVKAAVWRCRSCGRGQIGGKHWIDMAFSIHVCRYCKHEQ